MPLFTAERLDPLGLASQEIPEPMFGLRGSGDVLLASCWNWPSQLGGSLSASGKVLRLGEVEELLTCTPCVWKESKAGELPGTCTPGRGLGVPATGATTSPRVGVVA